MRSPWFAVSSLALCLALAAPAETRPHYGGTLRVETRAAITQLPRSDAASALAGQIAGLIYDQKADAPKRGSGPFRVGEFLPGRKLTLLANDDYPAGRPFLDSIEITMGRAPRDQVLDLQLGRADVIDLPTEAIRRAQQDGMRVAASAPLELVAIVFTNDDPKLREALALSVDRNAIFNVLLGRQGAPTAALLPNWMTGYGFVFDAGQDAARARQLRQESQRKGPLVLTYDPQDTLARSIAERVALDARAAGLAITPTTSVQDPDLKLVRILLPSTDPDAALAAVAAAVGASAPEAGKTPEQWYAAENELLEKGRVIPLLHLPVAYGLSPRVKDWPASKTGEWSLDQVWLEQKP
jgi:ABC-type transport system substrate-binding protein